MSEYINCNLCKISLNVHSCFSPIKLYVNHRSYRYLILEGLINRKGKRLIESLIMQDFIIEEVMVKLVLDVNLSKFFEIDQSWMM